MGLLGQADEMLAQVQENSAGNIDIDLSLREGATVLIASLINKAVPHQDSPEALQTLTNDMVGLLMTDYNGQLQTDQVLAGMDKEFLPQPGMLAHWARTHGFKTIEQHDEKLSPEDVAGKYVLTYYPPLAGSWAERTGSEIDDVTNKHWYSHTKSSLYNADGTPISSSNPEAFFNDNNHDATVYVPHDSISYVIDYEKLGLSRDDIAEGFKMQSEGMNIMDPKIQQSVFRLKDAGLSGDDIVKLWQNNTDITNEENLVKIESTIRQGNKDAVFGQDYIKSENAYHYNLQDRSCAIQPMAPILYATAAKIKRDGLNEIQADKLRQDTGLYNIYDEKNYGAINHDFYANYEQTAMENLKLALGEKAKQLHEDPRKTIRDFASSAVNTVEWAGAKTLRWMPEAANVAKNTLAGHAQEAVDGLKGIMNSDHDKFIGIVSSLSPSNLWQKYVAKKSPTAEAETAAPSILTQLRDNIYQR